MPHVEIQMDPDTVAALQAGPYYLRVLKAVATNASVALPTLWVQIPPQAIATNTGISWDDQYGVYSSTNPAPPKLTSVIQVPGWVSIGLGQTAMIAPNTGRVSIGGPGVSGTITIGGPSRSVAGITQTGGGQMHPIVGLSLPPDGSLVAVTPLEKVLLWFDLRLSYIGEVHAKAPQTAILVDLARGDAPSVTYNINNGWGSGSARRIGQGQDVRSLLILPAFEA
jgi:hypothetical protein